MRRWLLILAAAMLMGPLCLGFRQVPIQRGAVIGALADPNTVSFEAMYTKLKTYADTNKLTPAQLQVVKPYQVVRALGLTKYEKLRLGTSWDSLRRRIIDVWREEKEEVDYQVFLTAARDRILTQFPVAEFEREGMVVTIRLKGGQ